MSEDERAPRDLPRRGRDVSTYENGWRQFGDHPLSGPGALWVVGGTSVVPPIPTQLSCRFRTNVVFPRTTGWISLAAAETATFDHVYMTRMSDLPEHSQQFANNPRDAASSPADRTGSHGRRNIGDATSSATSRGAHPRDSTPRRSPAVTFGRGGRVGGHRTRAPATRSARAGPETEGRGRRCRGPLRSDRRLGRRQTPGRERG